MARKNNEDKTATCTRNVCGLHIKCYGKQMSLKLQHCSNECDVSNAHVLDGYLQFK